jgi:hypothetical protein
MPTIASLSGSPLSGRDRTMSGRLDEKLTRLSPEMPTNVAAEALVGTTNDASAEHGERQPPPEAPDERRG